MFKRDNRRWDVFPNYFWHSGLLIVWLLFWHTNIDCDVGSLTWFSLLEVECWVLQDGSNLNLSLIGLKPGTSCPDEASGQWF